jgi:arylsulfatase A
MQGKPGADNLRDYYAFSTGSRFEGILSGDGRWKLHLPHPYRSLSEAGNDGMAGKYIQETIDTALYDMEDDPYESENVLNDYPEIARELIRMAEKHKSRFYKE